MKIKEITVKKGYLKRETIKGTDGSYSSNENSAEVILTYEGEDINEKVAIENVKKQAQDLMDDEPDWIKEDTPEITESKEKANTMKQQALNINKEDYRRPI